jgi:hypothetical protein
MLLFTDLDFTSNPLFLRIRKPSRSVSEFSVLRSVVGNMIRPSCLAPNHVGIVPALPTLERIVRIQNPTEATPLAFPVNHKAFALIPNITPHRRAVAVRRLNGEPEPGIGLPGKCPMGNS